MKIQYARVIFNSEEIDPRMAAKIRGYFGNRYPGDEVLHNHRGDKVLYRYPAVQYKVVDSKPVMIGINEGAEKVQRIGLDTSEIEIEGKRINVEEKDIEVKKVEIGVLEEYQEYQFLTPWMPLNQKNSEIYRNAKDWEKEELLEKIFIGNLLSLSKGIYHRVTGEIHCRLDLQPMTLNFKNIKMQGFRGHVKTNFSIPDYLGVGRSVARGYGTVVRTGTGLGDKMRKLQEEGEVRGKSITQPLRRSKKRAGGETGNL